MRITLSNSSVNLNKGTISRLVTEEDRNKATKLGFWDKLKDFFRMNKKSDAVNELFDLIHENKNSDPSGANKFFRFEKIKNMAWPAHQELFRTQITDLAPGVRRYTLLIDDITICGFSSPGGWDELSKLESDGKPLIENYGDIIKQYAQAHAEDFKKEYPETDIKDVYGADEMMDYSSYFLKHNSEIKNKLLEFGLVNNDVFDDLCYELRESGQLSDEMQGQNVYTLMTLAGTLRILDNLDSQPEQQVTTTV